MSEMIETIITIGSILGSLFLIPMGFVGLITLHERKVTEKEKALREIRERNLNLVTDINRGTEAEQDLILFLLDHGFSPKAIFHDLYIRRNDGKTAQIDVVLATSVGIIVFEVKDYSGWIFGEGGQNKWTQVLSYGNEKYRFYNPIKQNNTHIEILKQYLNENVPFFNVVVFYGNCELKAITFIPKNTYVTKDYRLEELLHLIMTSNPEVKYQDKYQVIHKLQQAVELGNKENTVAEHIDGIHDMLGTDRLFN